ncbi:DUF1707 domain-containing protein [Yinghuangia seranimata]|uniref:DUF1707 domain-containing protein n=1 Tax=Yinghuangia seranimata TaxID=408067 RepID=UPI00248B3BB7|nr:DUF1707 domain-containing protein [Yinghuangia seranimata]MDI2128873.1 DUF1707 domain-containing protein [Yinghuangia seranimata]
MEHPPEQVPQTPPAEPTESAPTASAPEEPVLEKPAPERPVAERPVAERPVPARPVPERPVARPTGPVAAADVRASDADRERVAEILRTAFEEGRLTLDEHSERIEELYEAKTVGELEPLTFDLPVAGRPNLTKAPAPAPASAPEYHPYRVEPSADGPVETPTLIGIFGSAERRGPGRIGAKLRAVTVFGGVEIDLSEATFESPVLVVEAIGVFGGITVRVPEGVTVRGHGAGIFGGFAVRAHEAEDPQAPVVIVKGAAIFSGIEVRAKRTKAAKPKQPKAGESIESDREQARELGWDRDRDRDDDWYRGRGPGRHHHHRHGRGRRYPYDWDRGRDRDDD